MEEQNNELKMKKPNSKEVELFNDLRLMLNVHYLFLILIFAVITTCLMITPNPRSAALMLLILGLLEVFVGALLSFIVDRLENLIIRNKFLGSDSVANPSKSAESYY